MQKLVNGLKDLFESDIVHRDLKLPNVLLNFKFKDSLSINGQEYTEFDLLSLSKDEKSLFLATVDLQNVEFEVKIADFGFSKLLDK